MARILRSPAVVMTAYLLVFFYAGPWGPSPSTSHRNGFEIAIAVLLAVLAARGSRVARVIMIIYSVVGVLSVFFGAAHWLTPSASPFLYLLCFLAEIALLVSTPLYQRTHPGWSPGHLPAASFLPVPRPWAGFASAAIGLVITVLPFSDGLRAVACPAAGLDVKASCFGAGYGYPVAYRFDGIVTAKTSNAESVNAHGILWAAFAADWALWSLLLLTVLYLVWLARRERPASPSSHGGVTSGTMSFSHGAG